MMYPYYCYPAAPALYVYPSFPLPPSPPKKPDPPKPHKFHHRVYYLKGPVPYATIEALKANAWISMKDPEGRSYHREASGYRSDDRGIPHIVTEFAVCKVDPWTWSESSALDARVDCIIPYGMLLGRETKENTGEEPPAVYKSSGLLDRPTETTTTCLGVPVCAGTPVYAYPVRPLYYPTYSRKNWLQ
ncbi:hypothetical protein IAT38_000230 [Cryptococcus sp. DSM 104549]